ncbi:Hemolysin transporter protein ShlB precursor [Amantichitinum ursilacus]|uniref:Hemolysin transporter protein ShlB n=2 Tax=Amantichitinum ursilacus TaxID=857265 RepID=A0A0N0XI56_9NEIS|nr:Hemolysin transporter protein ShlB precursor [Amantichitinum ursilacus]
MRARLPSCRVQRVAALLALALAHPWAHAADAPSPANAGLPPVQQDQAIQLLNERRDAARQQQIEQTPAVVEGAPAPAPAAGPALDTPVNDVPEKEPSFQIDHIEFKGSPLFSAADISQLTQPFLGQRLGANRINLLLRRATDLLVKRGLITSRVYLGEQNLASGTLALTVVAGTIEGFTLNGQPFRPTQAPEARNGGGLTDAGTAWAFPDHAGQVLNLTDLEQGVDQINRLRRNQAEMQIQPGASAGGSVVNLNNKPGDALYYNVGLDNYGSSATGIVRLKVGVEADNLIGLQEAINASYIGSTQSNALVASVAVPWGYNVFSYTLSLSEYQNLIGDTALVDGSSRGHTFGFNRVLARGPAGKTAFDATLALWNSDRAINDVDLTPQALTVLRVALNRFEKFQLGQFVGYWSLEAGYSRGLGALGATADAQDLPGDDAHNQFNKFDANGSFSSALINVAGAALGYRGSFSAQWAHTGLYSSQQIFAGGNDSVRGFAQDSISGDCGVWLRNEISVGNVPNVSLGGLSAHIEPYVFIDGGHTRLLAGNLSQNIAGGGIGLRGQAQWQGKALSTELLLGRGLDQPASFGPRQTLLLASLNLSL